jgi:hypothetical protein
MSRTTKMHRVVLYVKDLNDTNSPEGLKDTFEGQKYPEFVTVGDIQTVDIGEWHDNHPLNKIGSDHESYFKALVSAPPSAAVAEVVAAAPEADKATRGFTFKSDVKTCKGCRDKKPLNSWNYCEYCAGNNIKLIFYNGKVWEQDTYAHNPHDHASYRSEILNFTPEQVTEFLTKQLANMTEDYYDLAKRIREYNKASRELEVPHRWRD